MAYDYEKKLRYIKMRIFWKKFNLALVAVVFEMISWQATKKVVSLEIIKKMYWDEKIFLQFYKISENLRIKHKNYKTKRYLMGLKRIKNFTYVIS